jgi:hypothetical protein
LLNERLIFFSEASVKTRFIPLIAVVAGSYCAQFLSISLLTGAIAADTQAQGRRSLLKQPFIEAAVARAKEKLPPAAASDLINKRHSMVVPPARFKAASGPDLLNTESPVSVPSATPDSLSEVMPAVPSASAVAKID